MSTRLLKQEMAAILILQIGKPVCACCVNVNTCGFRDIGRKTLVHVYSYGFMDETHASHSRMLN